MAAAGACKGGGRIDNPPQIANLPHKMWGGLPEGARRNE